MKKVLFATLLTLVIGVSAGVFAPAGNALGSVHVQSSGIDPMRRGEYLNAGYTDGEINQINAESYYRSVYRDNYRLNRNNYRYNQYRNNYNGSRSRLSRLR